jgi:hypothetical protein
MPSLWSAWDVALGHRRRYTRGSLRACVRRVPFGALEISYLFPELVPLGWVRRWRGGRAQSTAGPESAEFPDLPRAVNASLYATGVASLQLRRLWPVGTSLFVALRRR